MKVLRILWTIARWFVAIGLLLVAAYFTLQMLAVMNVYGRTQSTLGWLDALSTPICILVAAILVAPLSDLFFKAGWAKFVVIVLMFAWPAANILGVRHALTPKGWSIFEDSAFSSLSYGNGPSDFSIQCYPASAYDMIFVLISRGALPTADWGASNVSLMIDGQVNPLASDDSGDRTYTAYYHADRSVLQQLASVQANDSVVLLVGTERLELSVGDAEERFHTFATTCPE